MNASNKSRIFISYSHRGNGPEWKASLLRALHVFERHHLLDVWQDGKIRVSSFWDDDIKQAMSHARLAVVLLTKEALESEYILNTEFPFLRERQIRDKLPIFPVICGPCDWKAYDWLRATQAPNESNPLSQLSAVAQERVFRYLSTEIANELSRVALAEISPSRQLREGSSGATGEPDARTYLDKFPLTRSSGQREEKLIGREQELALLDLAFAQPHTAIVSLVAWGGVGKTVLVQHWLERLQREGWFGVRRVYAWSFYSQGTKEDRQASEDTFLAHALEWFGVECEPTLLPWDKGRLLADAVARERTLLILDGIEPLQYPPGPMGGQLRAPGVQSLLKQLARKANDTEHPGLCLVTTREPLTDLADFQRRSDSAWGSVLRMDLGNLTEEAGAALIHHAGANRAGAAEIKPDDKELLAASREVDGHALTLNLLGRFLARAHGGDIRRRDLVKFEEADRKEQGGTTFKMLAAFENWFAKSGEFGARQLAILRMLGLFDRPVDAGCISALRKPPPIDGLTEPLFTTRSDANSGQATMQSLLEEDWNTATSFLGDFGLVVIQADTDNDERLLDCHPLIREHFDKQLRMETFEALRSAHERIYGYLKDSGEYQPNTFEGLQSLYQAVAHGCHAKRYQHVCDEIYFDRIKRGEEDYNFKQFGVFDSPLTALACFFEPTWTRFAPGPIEPAQAWLLSEVSYCLRALGRLTEARETMQATFSFMQRLNNWQEAASAGMNLSEMELTLGEVLGAVRDAEKALYFAERGSAMPLPANISSRVALDIRRAPVRCRTTLADALHQAGRRDEALTHFREAERMQAHQQPEFPFLYSFGGFRYCDVLLASAERAVWQKCLHPGVTLDGYHLATSMSVEMRATKALKLVLAGSKNLLDVALHNLMIGRALLCSIIFSKIEVQIANSRIGDSVDGLRRAGTMHELPRGLLTRAWVRFLERDAAGARADLDEAWDIAERGPMRLHMADIHLHRARLFFREKQYPWKSPQDDLAAAEKLINDCGYHRRDEELADAKRAILGEA